MELILTIAAGIILAYIIGPIIISVLPMVLMLAIGLAFVLLAINLFMAYPITTIMIGILFALVVNHIRSEGESK